jgi:hypothetical protein
MLVYAMTVVASVPDKFAAIVRSQLFLGAILLCPIHVASGIFLHVGEIVVVRLISNI